MLYVLTGTRHTRSHLSRAYRSRVCARSRALRSSSLATCETLTPFAAANKSARCSAGAAPSPRTRLHTTLDDTRGVQHTRDLVLRARTARCTHTHTHTHTAKQRVGCRLSSLPPSSATLSTSCFVPCNACLAAGHCSSLHTYMYMTCMLLLEAAHIIALLYSLRELCARKYSP